MSKKRCGGKIHVRKLGAADRKQRIKATSRNSKSVSRLSYVRRRCATLDNRGCRQSRNPRTGLRPYAPLSDADLSPRFLRRNGTRYALFFVDKSLEIRFLRKHATHSITPQARKQSVAYHFAALVFYGLSAGSDYVFTRGYPM